MPRRRKLYWIMIATALFVAASTWGRPRNGSANPASAGASATLSKDDAAANAVRKPKLDMTKVSNAYSLYVDQKGGISLPKNYKTKWSHLGSFAVAKKKGQNISSMHDVYTQPEVVEIFNRTGKFPDGAVLVKEVRGANSGRMTTGHVAWSAGMDVWFVMIKDTKGRF